MHSPLSVPGRLAAAFLSNTIAMLVLGLLVYFRRNLEASLNVYPPASAFSGVLLYGYLVWLGLWAVLHVTLRRRATLGTLPLWSAVFLGATLFAMLMAQARVEWSAVFR